MGHELHDTLCQDLIGISRQAEALALTGVEAEGVSDALADRLQHLAALAASAARQARGLSHLLAVSEASDAPLEETLRGHVRQLEGLYGFTCELPPGEALLAFSPEQGAHIIRIIREALVNAARHARARRAWVDCLWESGQVILSISSDGNAARDPKTWKSGLGLRQMLMRAALLGAALTFRLGPQGAVVQLVLPPSRVVRAKPFNSGLTSADEPATRS
ncbi:MAG: histidine kinase [Verrucomicrobia bacterium]|nr:histidine kinase [Verrucomicrobiota bacterium]